MDKITTTIRREPLREIAADRKRVEYREIKPYWVRRLSSVKTPFMLRLINGMQPQSPEVTVLVRQVRRHSPSGHFELYLAKVVDVRHWDLKREQPTRKSSKPKRLNRTIG